MKNSDVMTSVCNRLACASASSRTRESTLTAMVDASVLLVLRIMTALSSFMVSLSPSFSIYKIYQSKTVGNISIVPFVSLLGNAHMWMMYGYFCGNIFPVVVSFGFGDLAALVYISVYYTFAEDRKYVLRWYCFSARNNYIDYTGISHILGYLSIVAAIILYGAPFEKTSFVLRNKNASPIQLPMVICGATNNALWVIYTPLDRNWFMFIPNACSTAIDLSDDDIAIRIVVSTKTEEIQNKIPNASPSVQPMASPLLPLSRENSFQLSSPSMSRGSSFQQMSSPALSSQSGSFRSSSSDCGFTAGALHINRAPRQK
ncbi:Sugar efflux transporter for intercellular exchange [Phytophthora infestans]|uniref:Sugar efflux transporter for intercellular exchange n=1 Tax=Phytophthora infestans TaxID=4787 RepID=A0A833SNX4_PHYIN|nr:Sugar efflux transporter for intercellular exchange [Phytophthora infestans]